MSDSLADSDLSKWSQHWQFANQTAFRIPEFLASVEGAWAQVSRFLEDNPQHIDSNPILFCRHALLSEKDENKLRNESESERIEEYQGRIAIVDFTQSSVIEEIRKTGEVNNPTIGKYIESLGKNSLWPELLKTLVAEKGQMGITSLESLLRQLPKLDFNTSDQGEIINALYMVLANASHVGFLPHHLNSIHFQANAAFDETIAYLLRLETKKKNQTLPDIEECWRVKLDGSISKEIDQPEPQDDIRWLLGMKDPGQYSDMFFKLWSSLNSVKTPDGYYIFIPVNAWSESPKDTADRKKKRYRAGPLLGWAQHRFVDMPAHWPAGNTKELEPELFQHVRSLSFMLEDFAVRYLEGETEWALERKWEEDDTAVSFMKSHFYHSCGWDCQGIEWEEMDFYFEPDEKGDILKVNLSRKLPNTGERQAGLKSLVAHLKRNSLCIIPADATARTAYFASLAEHARYFYRDRSHPIEIQREARRKLGEFSGQSKTFHDYSKDLNVLDDQLSRYANEAVEVRKSVEAEAEKLINSESISQDAVAALQRIKHEAARLGVPQFDYILRLRFLMSHLRVKTEGRLYEAPEWCWKWMQSGTKWDISLLIRALVWRPVGWKYYNEKANSLSEQALADDEFTWARLFVFEELENEPSHTPSVRRPLSDVLQKLFLQAHPINQGDFTAFFPAPTLNPDNGPDDQLLWSSADSEKKYWLPPVRLLPLLVFSLRAAFEHAYLRTLLRVQNVDAVRNLPRGREHAESVVILDQPGGTPGGSGVHHKIELHFPALGIEPQFGNLLEHAVEITDLPCGSWRDQMDLYKHCVRPWGWSCHRTPGGVRANSTDHWHYKITLEARP